MDHEITLSDIEIFHHCYLEDKENKNITEKISKKGIDQACLDKKRVKTFSYDFNLFIKEVKLPNQEATCTCNIYAFLRFLKSIMIQEKKDIDLSQSYLTFFDKLEKINQFYLSILKEKELDKEKSLSYANRYIGSFGTFHFVRELVNKYGFVPKKAMPDYNDKIDAALFNELLKDKVMGDALELLAFNGDKKALKEKWMKSSYLFLARILGNPPTNFVYKGKAYTPSEFKEEYLSTNLEEYIAVTTHQKSALLNSDAFIPSCYLKEEEIFKYDQSRVEKAILKQLKDGIAVWFSAEESTTLDYQSGILDTKVYRYQELLKIPEISKKDALLLGMIGYDHAMCITGVKKENDKIIQYKVDNSFGKVGKFHGHLIMSQEFFERDVIITILNQKYLK